AAGQDPAAQEPPLFLIERIVVEGLERNSAREIVISESRLRAGTSYSEAQLREAIYRVKRLLWVVDADMSLRKGSTRGAYELAIVVEGAKPVAFAVDFGGIYSVPDAEEDDGGYDGLDIDAAITVSGRKFIGSRGLLFGSAQEFAGDFGFVQLGYTRYGLFGGGSSATVALGRAAGDGVADNLQAAAQLDVPVTGNHVVRVFAGWAISEDRFTLLDGSSETRSEAWRAHLEWIYDTTDDPLFATTGRSVVTTARYESFRQRIRTHFDFLEGPVDVDDRFDDSSWTVGTQGRQFWPITLKQSLGIGAGASHGESGGFASSFTTATVEAVHAFNVWDYVVRERHGDLRLETRALIGASRSTSKPLDFERSQIEGRLQTSLLFRNAWGVFRFTFTYYDILAGDR
ncbi:MAG TPA: hypothetical protein VFS60_08910, partial [Thermoanaerobaculia bacterium]|nr:hypothetical protein [Thermoanaerobaculia bacterium]